MFVHSYFASFLFPTCCFDELYGKALAKKNLMGSKHFLGILFGKENDETLLAVKGNGCNLDRNYIIPNHFPYREAFTLALIVLLHYLHRCLYCVCGVCMYM